MKVYVLRLILGKATNYDQNGKLKNQTITSKYAGEMELDNILNDRNWQKIGACEISCVNAYDSLTPKIVDREAIDEVNNRIKADIQKGIKPKTEIELLREQVALLTEKINNPIVEEKKKIKDSEFEPKNEGKDEEKKEATEKDIRKILFEESERLGLNPAKNIKTDLLKDLVSKAKEN